MLAIVQIWTFLFSSFLKINAQALKYFCSSSSVNDNIFYRHYKNKRNSSIICFLFKLYKLLIDDNTTIWLLKYIWARCETKVIYGFVLRGFSCHSLQSSERNLLKSYRSAKAANWQTPSGTNNLQIKSTNFPDCCSLTKRNLSFGPGNLLDLKRIESGDRFSCPSVLPLWIFQELE